MVSSSSPIDESSFAYASPTRAYTSTRAYTPTLGVAVSSAAGSSTSVGSLLPSHAAITFNTFDVIELSDAFLTHASYVVPVGMFTVVAKEGIESQGSPAERGGVTEAEGVGLGWMGAFSYAVSFIIFSKKSATLFARP